MKQGVFSGLAFTLILVFWAGMGWSAAKEVMERVAGGEINWSQGTITAKGSGAPPKEARNIAQARLMAERAALADARRNLLEVLRGVQVDSASRVEKFILKDDQIRLQAEGFIQGSVEMKNLRRYLSDGAIEVTVAVNLSGDFLPLLLTAAERQRGPAKSASPLEARKPIPQEEPKAPPSQPPPVPDAEKPPLSQVPAAPPDPKPVLTGPAKGEERPLPSLTELPRFTGVVIDARGLGVKPALAPRILDENGLELYRGKFVPQEKIAQNGLVLYSRDLTAAQIHPRVGKNPLTVKGARVNRNVPADIFLGREAADQLAPFAQKGTFLEDCRVMIVLE